MPLHICITYCLMSLFCHVCVVSMIQVVEDGYEFFARRQLVTIFSAPNYCGEFDNAGAMMSVDDTLMCSFQILKPAEKRQRLSQAVDCKNPYLPILSVILTLDIMQPDLDHTHPLLRDKAVGSELPGVFEEV